MLSQCESLHNVATVTARIFGLHLLTLGAWMLSQWESLHKVATHNMFKKLITAMRQVSSKIFL